VPRCRHRSPPQPTLAADRGVADASTDDIYAAMDWLADQQDDIEAKLARRHLAPEPNPARMELFDLSSSWLEGTRRPLAARGYSRDGKKGGLQIEWSGGRRTPGRGARGRDAAGSRSRSSNLSITFAVSAVTIGGGAGC
jgi:hypothetical protein